MGSQHSTRVVRFGVVNCFLVAEDDGLTLIDTLLPRSAGIIGAEAERLGRPIVRILLTHAHQDHVGSVDALVAALGDVEVMASDREARFLRGDRRLDPEEEKGRLRGGYPRIATAPTRTLHGGERIGSLEAIPAPGHTPGQLAFLDTRDRTLYCGDAYATLGGVATMAKPNPRFPLPALVSWHRPTALETARALRALDPARLAPGHGRVVESPGAAMDAAIRSAA